MVDATMADDELLSGTALLEKIEDFLRGFVPLPEHLKISVVSDIGVRAIAIRCHAIESLADFLADHAKLAVLAHQHDVVLVMGNVALLGGDVSWLKQHDEHGREIDIKTWKETFEVKNGSDIGPRDVAALVGEHFDEMVASKPSKSTWWLCFFTKRPVPKGKLRDVCMYYLNIVEIAAAGLVDDVSCRDSICRKAMRVSEELEKRIIEEDGVDEGFLVPVKNIWIVDKLRMERDLAIQEKDALEVALQEKENALEVALQEKENALAEERAEYEKTIAELKRRLGEE